MPETITAKNLRYRMKSAFGAALAAGFAALSTPAHAAAEAERYLAEAQAAATRGDRLIAIQLYQSAIIHAPAATGPYLGIAEFYAGSDQPELAEKYFGMALGLEPANAPALRGLALLALSQGDLEAANAHHEILLETCAPQCPEAAEVRNAINGGVTGDAGNPTSALAAD